MAIFNSYIKLPEGTEIQYLLEMSVAPYLVFGTMGAARLPMVRRIENPGVLQ